MYQIRYRTLLLAALLLLTVHAADSTQENNRCSEGSIDFGSSCVKMQYIEGCAIYKQNGECEACEYGYSRVNGKCEYAPESVKSCCGKFSTNGSCEKCAPGLYLDGNACIAAVLPGCLEKRQNVCSNCAEKEFYRKDGRCHPVIPGCSLYGLSGVCQQCLPGFVKELGVCISISSVFLPKPINCKETNEYSCTLCENSFYLSRTGQCIRFEPGCLQYLREECVVCARQFDLINGKCVIEGCELYNSNGCQKCLTPYKSVNGVCKLENCFQAYSGKCRICEGNFRLRNGKCVAPVQDVCRQCAQGFFLGSDGKCYFSIVGCESYEGTQCRVCKAGFVNFEGRCFIYGCEENSLTEQGCQKCIAPFVLTNQRTCAIPNCAVLNALGCGKCQDGFHLERGTCVRDSQNCVKYVGVSRDTEECRKCIDGFVLNRENTCEPIRPGCVYENGKCFSCYYPFVRDAQRPEVCVISGCKEYNLQGCIKCDYPFVANKGTCVVEYCQLFDEKTNACKKCQDQYHLASQSGICVRDEPNCQQYCEKDGICVKCIGGFTLNKSNKCIKTLDNCIEMDMNGNCIQCQEFFKLVAGSCQLSDPYCQKFIAGKGCGVCKPGFHLKNFQCIKNDPFCSTYSQESNTQYCVKCADSYTLDDLLSCIRSQPGCVYKNGICIQCRAPFKFNAQQKNCFIRGCDKYDNNGCYKCKSPFELSGSDCAIPFCAKYGQEVCQECQNGYQLINGACIRKDPKCVQFDKSGVCKTCANGFALFEGVCIKEDKYCVTYSKSGGCNKCQDGYFINLDKICRAKEPGCIYQKGECAYCELPFQMHPIAKKCRINGCLEVTEAGCQTCKYPFERVKGSKECQIPNCVTEKDGACVRCSPGFHLKKGMECAKDRPECLKYNQDGDCELCDRGYMIMSSGECEVAEDNCVQKCQETNKCLACKDGYFINYYFQCQRKDDKCVQYTNGVCSKCDTKHFLYDYICFPYSPGCVKYSGKDCVQCKASYELVNAECFLYKKPGLHLEGEDDEYNFAITPIDITKSKYYIDNLSPASAIGKYFYSSVYSADYSVCLLTGFQNDNSKGWKAEQPRTNEFVGVKINSGQEPVTFYAIQLEQVQGNYITEFYLEYSVDGNKFIRVETPFKTNVQNITNGIQTLYFTGIYARSIRIIISGFKGWPAGRVEFFYYDMIRFRKISNLKSLKFLKESIQSNFVDRMDNQMYINQRYFFQPATTCKDREVCWTGLQLCQARQVEDITLTSGDNKGYVRQFYLMYSLDGRAFNCYQKCRKFQVGQQLSYALKLDDVRAKNIRVYPTDWFGKPNFAVTYNYH